MVTKDILKEEHSAPPPAIEKTGFLQRIKRSAAMIKASNWEYWPMWLTNLPLFFIWLWFAIRARDFFFFSAVNPAIETGGLWGESKFNILKRIPSSYVPVSAFIRKKSTEKQVVEKLASLSLKFPLIIKPDIGERGMLVEKINSLEELLTYLSAYPFDFIVQEFVDLPVELAVMHHRFPGSKKGRVTSVCIKETLKVKGDGYTSVEELIRKNPRAILQLSRFRKEKPGLLSRVPAPGQVLELEPIGNHCRGTLFLNGNHHIDTAFTRTFTKVAKKMDDIHYGRFDLKCRSIEDLKQGRGFMVMEYNGIGAEPAHIYDPSYPIWKKYCDLYRHWRIIFRIYRVQRDAGLKGMSLGEAIRRWRDYSQYKKAVGQIIQG